MSAFADSSALVKLYADETGHEHVRTLDLLVVSQLARVEVPAAFWRKQRMGELGVEDAGVLVAAFVADYFGTEEEAPLFAAVAITAAILEDAAELTGTRGLRAYDAVQLASARAAVAADSDCSSFVAFDIALRDAAVAEGFDVVPAALGPVPD